MKMLLFLMAVGNLFAFRNESKVGSFNVTYLVSALVFTLLLLD